MTIPELENQLDSLYTQLVIWTFVVGLGLIIEYAIPLYEFLQELMEWLFHNGPRPKLKTKAVCGAIGAILITVGVIKEGLIEFSQSRTETTLSTANGAVRETLEADLKRAKSTADSAVDQAKLANQVAKDASDKAKVLDKNLSSVDRRATELAAKLTDATHRVEDANRKADDELNARIKLEARLINIEACSAPRVLQSWSANGKTSVDRLKLLEGTTVFIEFVPDNEARRAASNIAGHLLLPNGT